MMDVFGAALIGKAARRAGLLVAPLLALAPLPLVAQDSLNDFDLRPRATPTPAPPPVVGPVDPENPTVRVRPRAEPRSEPQPTSPALVLPEVSSAPATTGTRPATATAQPRSLPRATGSQPPIATQPGASAAQAQPGATEVAPTDPVAATAAAPYQPRQLDVVSSGGPSLIWALVGGLAVLLGVSGWLVWSRHFRHSVRALPAPEILRPHVPAQSGSASPRPAPVSPTADPANDTKPVPALGLVLQATRMSATLVNTTLSYRLSVTNNGSEPLRDVIVAGDMIAAHASRPVEELLGSRGAALPELHRIAGLAPGESVVLGGDIRLPLVSITPIRSGNAALFVPLARLRARGVGASGATIESGGTFLVGQPGAAAKGAKSGRLQPFRLDLGPRNYSKLGQQLLPAT